MAAKIVRVDMWQVEQYQSEVQVFSKPATQMILNKKNENLDRTVSIKLKKTHLF